MRPLADADSYEAGAGMNPIVWYISLRAVDRFESKHGRYPGVNDEDLQKDEDELWRSLQEVHKELSGGGEEAMDTGMTVSVPKKEHAVEMARYGAAELHNIAAIVGGIGAQEAVKVITQQYVPLDNTFIYNGIASVGGLYRL